MAALDAGLSRDVYDDLRQAAAALPLLEAAGAPLKLWEAYALAAGERALFRRELRRLAGGGKADLSPEFLGKLRVLRDRIGPLFGKLRKLMSSRAGIPDDPERQDMILGFIAMSPAAREAAARWVAEPERHGREAAHKLRVIDGIVERYRKAIRSDPSPVAAVAAPEPERAVPAPAPEPLAVSHVEPPPPARPVSPSALTAHPASGEVQLSWFGSADATGYVVRRATAPGGPFEPVARPTSTAYTDTGLENGRTYYYAVRSAGPGGESADSAPAQAAPLGPPRAPSNLVANAVNSKVTLTWTASPGAAGYTVRRATAPGGPFTPLASASGPTYTDANLANGSAYSYVVSALNAGGESPNSPPATAMPVAPPPAPSDLAATSGNANVALVWNAVPGAAHYRLMRSTTPGGPYTAIASPADPAHLDATVANGTTYYYVVRAVNAGGKGPISREARAMPVTPPPAPTGLTAAAANSQVTLSWAAAPRATAYAVKRASAPGGPFAPIGAPAETSFTDTAAVNGTAYFYAVCATNAGGEGPASVAVESTPVAPPAPPAEVYATPANGRITLAWAASPRATGYAVRRAATPAGPFATIGTTAAPPFTDSNLANGATYHYLVVASNAGGESGPSPLASATPLAPPAAPGGLSARPGHGRVSLAWSASPRAAAYVVKRAASPNGPFAPIGTPSATSTVDADVTNGTSYSYAVSATNAGGESADSAPVEATPLAPPAVPTGVSASPGNGQVSLAWAASSRAVSYSVRRSTTLGGPHAAIAASAAPSFTDTGLANGTTYYYVVSAANACGESAPSLETSATPVAPPAAQGSLSASPGNAQVELAWPPTPGASAYRIRRAMRPAGPWSPIASPSGTRFTDAGLANGETYFYTVSALNAGGESPPSAPAEASPVAPPAPPETPGATPGNARVALAWTAVPGATRYRVKRATSSAGPFAEIAAPPGPAHVDITVTNGTTYWYAVTAVSSGGESAPSAPAPAAPVAPPAAPAGLSLTPGNGRIAAAWNAAPRAARYSLKRSTTPAGPYSPVASTEVPSYADAGLVNGVTYYYVVSAVNAGGEGPDSAPALAAPVAPPPAPTGLAAVAGNGQASLAWSAVAEAVAYTVKRADAPGRPHVPVAGPAGPSYTDADLENGRSYSYVVSAVNAGGEGPDSAPATATPLSAPDTPRGLAATPGNAHVTLAWTAAESAAGYAVKRATAPGGPYARIAACSDPQCDDGMVTNGATYYYVVSAVNAGGESPDSLPAEAKPVAPPAVPTGLTCIPGDARIQLAWTAAEGAERYIVKRSFERRGPFLEVGTAAGTSYVDRDLQNGSAYYYVVTAANPGGESQRSSRAGAVPIAPPPPPAELAAAAGNGEVLLSWRPSPGARRYRIKRSLDRRGPYTSLTFTAEPRHLDRDVANGTTYFYVVTAVNAGGSSVPSARASATPAAPPAAPPALAATPGDGRVSLLWTAVPEAAQYRVFRGEPAGGPGTLLAELPGTSYVDTSAENGRKYAYAVRSVNAGGESPDSPRAEAVPLGPPPIPADPTAAPGDSHVTLLWKPSPGAAGYTVKRGTSAAGPFVPVATPTQPAYTDTGLSNGTTYFYKVRAVNPAGESPDTPPLAAIPVPLAETPLPGGPPSDSYTPLQTASRGTDGDGSAAAAVLAPVRGRSVADLDDRAPLPFPAAGGTLAGGVDLEKMLDLKRVARLRSIFEATAQKIETWEVLCLLAEEGHDARREMERLVRFKEAGDSRALNDGAVALFERLLRIRSETGALVREARVYLEGLGLRLHDRETLDIALGFLVSAPKGRQRARLWIDHPADHRRQAAVYMDHALSIAQKYRDALRSR